MKILKEIKLKIKKAFLIIRVNAVIMFLIDKRGRIYLNEKETQEARTALIESD